MDDEKRLFRKFFEAKADLCLEFARNSTVLSYYFLSSLIDNAYTIAKDISSFGYNENEFSDRLRKIGFIHENETYNAFKSRECEARNSELHQSVDDTPDGLMGIHYEDYITDEQYQNEEPDYSKIGTIKKLLDELKRTGKKPDILHLFFD